MTEEMVALLGDGQAGRVRRDRRGRLSFVYDEAWRNMHHARPLSVSMPLTAAEHGHAAIDAFLWGLLPDNELVLGRWAQRFQVSARNAFALVSHVGEDCASDIRLDPEALLRRMEHLADRLPDHAAAVREEAASQGLKHRIIDRLCGSLTERAAACRRIA